MFDDPLKLFLGFFTGVLFGFFLQKGQVAKFHVIVGQLLLKDWTVVKIMATAIAVGSVGVHFLIAQGVAELHIQEAVLNRLIPGAILFGVGMALFGLCPGTSVAACGQGARDAWAGVVGMFTGALLYVFTFPVLRAFFAASSSWGKVTVAEMAGVDSLLLAAVLAATIFVTIAILRTQRRPTLQLAGGSR